MSEVKRELVKGTTDEGMELLKATTTKRSIKSLVSETEPKTYHLEEAVIWKRSDEDRLRVSLKCDGIWYSGVSNDIVDVCNDICDWVISNGREVLPMSVTLSKSAGRYGKYILDIN